MLDVRNVRAGYGAINVLWDARLVVAEGSLTTIIGPNGAGKTTLLRAIMGQVAITQGTITLDGRTLNGTPTWQMADLSIAMIPEGRMIFRDMSVEENVLLGAYPIRKEPHVQRALDAAYALFPKLRERRKQLAGSLSGGEAQMLAMARGLVAAPRLLLIDEPSSGLAPVIAEEMFATLAKLKALGRTMVLVEQNTRRAIALADHVYLMQGGKVVLSQPASEVDLERLHALYFAAVA